MKGKFGKTSKSLKILCNLLWVPRLKLVRIMLGTSSLEHKYKNMSPQKIYWSKFHVNIVTGSGAMAISFYKGLTRNPETGNTPI